MLSIVRRVESGKMLYLCVNILNVQHVLYYEQGPVHCLKSQIIVRRYIYCKILIAVIEFIKRYSCIFVNLIELISNLCMTEKVARFSLFHDRQ